MRLLRRVNIFVRDYLRFSNTARRVLSVAIRQREHLRQAADPNEIARSVKSLARAARLSLNRGGPSRVDPRTERLMRRWSPTGFHWDEFFYDSRNKSVGQSIILKRPQSRDEKGVLFVAFEFQWMRLFRHANIELLARDYDLVLSPTWSPPHDLALLLAARMWPREFFTILSNLGDLRAFQGLSPKIQPIPLLASNWVNPDAVPIRDPASERVFDIVMVANFALYKRHFALFRALARMNPSVKALLIGVPWEGRSRRELELEAKIFGVLDRITIREGLYGDEMFRELQSAKVSVIMSLLEGSCVAIAESLFAGVPVGVLSNARIGSKAFINERTGRLLDERSLASDLTDFLRHYREYHPREWAVKAGIGCCESSKILNDHLKRAALSQGKPWSVDIAPMHWRPYPRYVCRSDRTSMRDEYLQFEATYGAGIELTA